MSQKDGGPAFPSPQFAVPENLPEEHIALLRSLSGMRLRQYYKAKAMQGMLANPNWDTAQQGESERLARAAGFYADHMLAEDIEHTNREQEG